MQLARHANQVGHGARGERFFLSARKLRALRSSPEAAPARAPLPFLPVITRRIAVIGLGYVGLPVARAFARVSPGTLGFDRDAERVARLRRGLDPTGALGETGPLGGLELTADPGRLAACDFHVIAVPTPIDEQRAPDLSALADAARTVGRALARGAVVVVESTVYPGVTEELVVPLLEQASGLVSGRDFGIGYSPERINPGDPEHRFERVPKVIAAADPEALRVMEECYGAVVEAGVVRAPSIRVAEAAKVLENVQRDLNIALMNEVARICRPLGLETREVLETAATKWNFVPYRPGLVGGHCIGVDPYFLAARARELGVEPRVILAGRAVNDGMAGFVAEEVLALLASRYGRVEERRVAVLGLTFKADIADVRNSRVPEVLARLRAAGAITLVHDPRVDPALAARTYGLELASARELVDLDLVLLAVAHRGLPELAVSLLGRGAGILVDLAWAVPREQIPAGTLVWSL